jgi:hypothetical protein
MNLTRVERVYPDTSYWMAMRCRADDNHAVWQQFHPQIEMARLLWSPWTHFELFNAFRQMTLGSDAVLTEAEANRLIASLEKEVQLGYFDPCVIDWRDELRECRELSAQFGCRTRRDSNPSTCTDLRAKPDLECRFATTTNSSAVLRSWFTRPPSENTGCRAHRPHRLRNALCRLLGNAHDYRPQQGVTR